ncbi:pentatricopeptide repeat-containing protein OTP51, chloroplastic isoform X2 [Salvia miltiorrhiza]|uniref:pentatricopeptide repeat-containing protein OTP51, chloroplastic isoform X2 n=1 Tax=Salvia miltiorrhiza TaxID=226208 RepID=UPI0025AC8465|nr:pentatricopeptide repeat-containing protein OTP51, chloroplastic isoform X2 [Salvia miltiorrhiza]
MLLSFHCITHQITPSRTLRSFSHHHRLPALSLPSKPYRRFPLPIIVSSSVSAGATVSGISEEEKANDYDISEEGKGDDYHFYGEKREESFDIDGSFELAELKRFRSPVVEVKELEELPEQWRRSRLAWLCKELPAHRLPTFIRVLNAQRKWIRQDDCTYIAVHCMRIRENESAFRVYKWTMQQHWFQFDFALVTKLADYMGKERKYLKCRELYNDIINQGLVPNESTFHILIVAYLSSSGPSCLEEACSIYNQMIHLGNYKPRLSLHNSLFRALVSKAGGSCKHHLKQAEFIFHNLTMSGLKVHNDIYGGLIWLHSYQDVIDKERIVSLRKEMKSAGIEESTEVLVSVLRACAKHGDLAAAESIWTNILSSHSKPPPQAFVYLMEVYSRVGKPIGSLKIFRVMQELCSPNVVSYYKIIEILCKAQEIELAESLMVEFINSDIKSLTRSFIDMMTMYSNLSLHDKVESTFFRCLEECHPNQTVYNLYLDSLVQTGSLDKAEQIFSQMHADEAIGVDAKSCNNILRGYLTYEHHAKARKIYDFMCQKKYEIESSLMEKLEYVERFSMKEAKRSSSLKLSQEQREILIGLLLGGLRLKLDEEKRSYAIDFVFREDNKIHYFLRRHIHNRFHEWLAQKVQIDDNNGDIPCQFTTIPHSCFQLYADQFWPQGLPVIPKLIHRWLTPRVLAYWYMYGGYKTSSGDILLKLKFDKEDVTRIAKTIKAKSLNCRVKRRGRVFWMGFLGTDAAEFWKLTEPFVLADLRDSLEANVESLDGRSGLNNVSFSSDSDTDGNTSDHSNDEAH